MRALVQIRIYLARCNSGFPNIDQQEDDRTELILILHTDCSIFPIHILLAIDPQ